MNNIEIIRSKIYEIRGVKVMLDHDLASMYGVTTSNFNKAVKRNLNRFPEDFMFQLTKDEWERLRFQIGISNKRGGIRYMPFVFTEHGVAMLSSVINSEPAIQINIAIMRTFVSVRKMLSEPKPDRLDILENRIHKIEEYIEEVITDVNDVNEDTRMQIELINESLAELKADRTVIASTRPKIGFKS